MKVFLGISILIFTLLGGFILMGYVKGVNVPKDFGKISKGMSIYDVEVLYENDLLRHPYHYKVNKSNRLTYCYLNNEWVAITEMTYDLDGIITNVYEFKRYDGPFHGFRYLYETYRAE